MSKRKPVPAAAERTSAEVEATEAATQEAEQQAEEQKDEQGPETDPENDAEDGEKVEMRVLVAFDGHEPNAVISVNEAERDELVRDGKADAHPDAVGYAKSL